MVHFVFLQVNIIPVIGKSDSCTKTEIAKFKAKILGQLEVHQIQTYSFPESVMKPEVSRNNQQG